RPASAVNAASVLGAGHAGGPTGQDDGLPAQLPRLRLLGHVRPRSPISRTSDRERLASGQRIVTTMFFRHSSRSLLGSAASAALLVLTLAPAAQAAGGGGGVGGGGGGGGAA